MEETVFAKIIRKEIPANIVYEDGDVVAFLDISPHNPGHTLVVPKTYARNIFDIDEKTWSKLTEAVRILTPVIKKAVGADGVNVSMNNEPAAGQVVFHAHIHIIPRFTNDAGHTSVHRYHEGEAAEVAEKIRSALTSA